MQKNKYLLNDITGKAQATVSQSAVPKTPGHNLFKTTPKMCLPITITNKAGV